jgi:hypothetical protein
LQNAALTSERNIIKEILKQQEDTKEENVLQRENIIVSIHSMKLEVNGFGHNMMEVKNTNSS